MSTGGDHPSSARDERHASLDSGHENSMNNLMPSPVPGTHYAHSATSNFSAQSVHDLDFGGYQLPDQQSGNAHPELISASVSATYESPDATRGLDYLSLQQHNYLHPQVNTEAASSSVGQGLSPTSNIAQDQISPSSFMSDHMYQDLGAFQDSNFDYQLLGNRLENILNFDNGATGIPFETSYSTGGDPSQSFPAQGLPLLNGTQAPPPSVRSGSQLLSPSLTQSSSPVIEDASRTTSKYQQRPRGASFGSRLSPVSADMAGSSHFQGRMGDQSPAHGSSPGGVPIGSSMGPPSHLTSPIVRVENYSRGESPIRPAVSRTLSKRSQGSKRSGVHLSPYAAEESSSEDEGTSLGYGQREIVAQPGVQRNDDGSWIVPQELSQGGLNPAQRSTMCNATTVSADDLEKQRLVAERNDEVANWLEHSDVGSDAGDRDNSLKPPKKAVSRQRRARSFNEVTSRRPTAASLGLGLHANLFDDSAIPGPGIYIDERSENDDYDDDTVSMSAHSSMPPSPPAKVDLHLGPDSASYFPNISESVSPQDASFTKPWHDPPLNQSPIEVRYQPDTSNAAIMRFKRRAKDIESASLAATIGSRKNLSETDLSSLYKVPAISRNLGEGLAKSKSKDKSKERRGSFLGNIRLKRTNSNVLKRKQSNPLASPQSQAIDASQSFRRESQGNRRESQDVEDLDQPRRSSSWKRITRVDTNLSVASKDSGSGSKSPGPSRPFSGVVNTLRRARSRSDLGKPKMGLTELITQHGGPPMLTLATTPMSEAEHTKVNQVFSSARDDEEISPDEDLSATEAVVMDLTVRSDPIIPSTEGFRTHARQLNPRLVDYMVERITQEQMRRYKRLLEFKVKHVNAVKNRNCSSTKFCLALGGESKNLPPRMGNKDSETPFIGFQVTAPGSDDEEAEATSEGTVVAAQFPPGVPLPPVKRLPAEFECPLCFKVKKFYKPSDWTKHVHEDVQPFTCTFPNCGEPKSFKRKADWVRHENERHRQLENWTCDIGDCTHQCFRKDNFVQHLVREHKIPEPRTRTGRSANSARDGEGPVQWQGTFAPPANNDPTDDIWTVVERCRHDTTKQPKDEPCRFCSNICNSWKKLTVHLAKHMEQISMPVLPLVDQKQVHADTIISPIDVTHQEQLITPNKSPIDRSQQLSRPSPAPVANFNPQYNQPYAPGYGQSVLRNNVAPPMHSYPPSMVGYTAAPLPQQAVYEHNAELPTTFDMRSYPGMIDVPTQERASVAGGGRGGAQQPSRPSVNTQNSSNRYMPVTPDSAYGRTQIFESPVQTAHFSENVGDIQAQYLAGSAQHNPAGGNEQFTFDQNPEMQFPQPNQFLQTNQYMPNQNSGHNQFNY